jgi:tetratricopeptide (TPR) repeat protein
MTEKKLSTSFYEQSLSFYKSESYQEAEEALNKYQAKHGISTETLLLKAEILESQNKNEESLKLCELIFHFDPLNKEAHQLKLKLLKRLRQFQYITKYLNQSREMFPITGISNLTLSEKFTFK